MSRTDAELRRALDAVRSGERIIDGLRSAEVLAHEAGMASDPAACLRLLLVGVHQRDDQLLSIAAVHAISATRGEAAAAALTELLVDGDWHIAEHAAWALSARSCHRPAMSPLTTMVARGGFAGMLAQRTLAGWAPADGRGVGGALLSTLASANGDGARRRLIETLGLVPGATATVALERAALDADQGTLPRAAAIAALGDRHGDRDLLVGLADLDSPLAPTALLALADRADSESPPRGPALDGMRLAQLFLHADLGAGPSRAGAGDNGGIATLLALLSGELAALPDVAEVVTIGRGRAAVAPASGWWAPDAVERFAGVAFGPPGGVDMRAAWPYRVQIERGLRRVLHGIGRIDALHLRMADVGTLAASRVARHLEIPIVFTAAPDPHVVLRSLDQEGALTRANFGDSDALEHWWFRARMVERLAAHADRVTILPRVGIRDELRDLLGYDASRAVVIPEGVHAATVRAAATAVRRGVPLGPAGGVVGELGAAIEALAAERRSLPLIVTVGRLHPMKGIDRIVQAWAENPTLRAAANVVIVGGDLESPSPDELDVLTTIDDTVAAHGAEGVILLGHRPHGDVARVLAAAAIGTTAVAANGIYVGGARKEEFGLAIVEAMAAGLPVVAPAGGGPATYVDDGVTGVLVDTSSLSELADGMLRALRLATVPGRGEAASEHILEHLTIERMAARLAELYSSLVAVRA